VISVRFQFVMSTYGTAYAGSEMGRPSDRNMLAGLPGCDRATVLDSTGAI